MSRPNRRRPADKTDSTASTDAAPRLFPAAFAFGFAATLVPVLVSAPEGAIREGDFNPVALLFLFFAAAVSVAALRFPLLATDKSVPTAKTGAAPSVPSGKTAVVSRRAVRVADVALALFLGWATVSYLALIFGQTGDVRLATNAFWLFAVPTLLYFFARRFRSFFDSRLISGVFVLIFACAAAESLHSFYSLTVATPRLRAAYLADPEGVLAENGMTFSTDAERARFENRLLESSEPTGTFGLANTLAGLLAPTFVLGAAAFLSAVNRRRRAPRKTVKTDATASPKVPQTAESPQSSVPNVATLAVWAVALALVLFVLLATKSRSGFLGATFGVGVWGVFSVLAALRRAERKTARRVAFGTAGAFVGAALLLVGAFATGLLDREVFAEAGKSLGYRLDYWRSTAAMIADSPLLGVGPGEFQSVYARYISPTASEFIADPHSFAFELAALFGVPAFGAFAVFLGALGVAAVATVLTAKLDAQPNQPNQPNQ
ncbi:MAG: O-antigen ligase family protein, partial [Thermoguttaceae bacterium]|nr:O-antigen ligase family protein [Thermoguttaceae bacterium]